MTPPPPMSTRLAKDSARAVVPSEQASTIRASNFTTMCFMVVRLQFRVQQRDKPFRDALRMEIAAAGDDWRASSWRLNIPETRESFGRGWVDRGSTDPP